MLVIDDLGSEYRSDWFLSGINLLLDVRYGAALRTVITTNLDGETFKQTYGDSVIKNAQPS